MESNPNGLLAYVFPLCLRVFESLCYAFLFLFFSHRWHQFPPSLPCNGENAAAAPTSCIVAAFTPIRWLFSCLPPHFCDFFARKIRNSVARPVLAAVRFGGKLANFANHLYHLEQPFVFTLNSELCTVLQQLQQQQTPLPQQDTAETMRLQLSYSSKVVSHFCIG
jgi:hypothetical protein